MFNTYTEEFKRNVVAVNKSGYRVSVIAKRLHIPPTSIRNWIDSPKYDDVQPAGAELLAQLPLSTQETQGLIRIGEMGVFSNSGNIPTLKMKIGNVEFETPENIPVNSFKALILALKETHVL